MPILDQSPSQMAIQYQSANPWPIHQPNANLGTNHPYAYPWPISQTMTNLWPICQSLVNQTTQCLYSENLTSMGPIYQSITNRLLILGQCYNSKTILEQSVQRQRPHPNHQSNLSGPLIKTWSARIRTESILHLLTWSIGHIDQSRIHPT